MNVILAVNDKKIEKYVTSGAIPEVTVLSTLRHREPIVDAVYNRNPNLLILSPKLKGKMDMKDLIRTIRKSRPDVRILYIYGDRDDQYKMFLDFLILNGVYDFLIDSFDDNALNNAILNKASLDHVKGYLLSKEEREALIEQDSTETTEKQEPSASAKVLIVEKYVGNMTVGVGSLYHRAGCTHTVLAMTSWLQNKKADCAAVLSPADLQSLQEFYEVGESNKINGIYIYSSEITAKQNHKFVLIDIGCISSKAKKEKFTATNVPILLSPAAPWEIDTLTEFLTDNTLATAVRYAFWPISDKTFKEYRRNLKQGNCHAWRLNFAPEWFLWNENAKPFSEMLKPITEQLKKIK